MRHDLRRVATHEAGHAVVAHVLGGKVESVSIEPIEDYFGSTPVTWPVGSTAENQIMFRYAGQFAEIIRYHSQADPVGAGSDDKWISAKLFEIYVLPVSKGQSLGKVDDLHQAEVRPGRKTNAYGAKLASSYAGIWC